MWVRSKLAQQRQRSNIWISEEACESSPIPCPHPSTLTCVSLTMETFSPRVGGGLELWKKKKVLSASLIVPLLETRFSSKLTTLTFLLSANLWLSTVVDRTAGELTRVHGVSRLQWLLKIPPRLEHVLCKQVLAQKNEAGHLKICLRA